MDGRNRARIPISAKNGRHNPIAMNKQRRVGETIAIQSWLRPALTPVMANKDFAIFREQLNKVGGLLEGSLLEEMAMDFAVDGQEGASAQRLSRRKEWALKALRVETLRMLLGNPSFREFSKTVASSELLADFCGVRRIDGIRGISKSTLERASKFFTDQQVRWMHQVLIEMSGGERPGSDPGLGAVPAKGAAGVATTAGEHRPTELLRPAHGDRGRLWRPRFFGRRGKSGAAGERHLRCGFARAIPRNSNAGSGNPGLSGCNAGAARPRVALPSSSSAAADVCVVGALRTAISASPGSCSAIISGWWPGC